MVMRNVRIRQCGARARPKEQSHSDNESLHLLEFSDQIALPRMAVCQAALPKQPGRLKSL